jgi:hypothetical protein
MAKALIQRYSIDGSRDANPQRVPISTWYEIAALAGLFGLLAVAFGIFAI